MTKCAPEPKTALNAEPIFYVKNLTQTGVGTCITCPVERSFPVFGSIRNGTTVSESWFAARKNLPAGSIAKLRGVLPRSGRAQAGRHEIRRTPRPGRAQEDGTRQGHVRPARACITAGCSAPLATAPAHAPDRRAKRCRPACRRAGSARA